MVASVTFVNLHLTFAHLRTEYGSSHNDHGVFFTCSASVIVRAQFLAFIRYLADQTYIATNRHIFAPCSWNTSTEVFPTSVAEPTIVRNKEFHRQVQRVNAHLREGSLSGMTPALRDDDF
jgi:hypothetical protein